MTVEPGASATGGGFVVGIWSWMRRPRILLWLLAAWSAVGVLSQVFVNSGLFLDIHDLELDGALGGLALGFDGAALAVLYFYCSRDPSRYHAVFWLAFVDQVAEVAAALYHWLIGTFSFESVLAPIVVGALLVVLVFLHILEPRTKAATVPQ